jgi:hypothetical protein
MRVDMTVHQEGLESQRCRNLVLPKEETYPRIYNLISNSHPSGVSKYRQSVEAISVGWVVEIEPLRNVFDCFSYVGPVEISGAETLRRKCC